MTKMVVHTRVLTLLECWCLVAVYTLEEKILVNARFYAPPEKTLLYSRTMVFTSVFTRFEARTSSGMLENEP